MWVSPKVVSVIVDPPFGLDCYRNRDPINTARAPKASHGGNENPGSIVDSSLEWKKMTLVEGDRTARAVIFVLYRSGAGKLQIDKIAVVLLDRYWAYILRHNIRHPNRIRSDDRLALS
jgi:hypothetical protein